MALEKKPSENIVGKGENAGNHHFLLFQQCFLFPKTNFNFSVTFILWFARAFSLNLSKIPSFGTDLMHLQNVSTRVSLHSPHRLIWAKIFCT